MSYKYKDEILADIGPEPNCNYDFEKEEYYKKIDELNHVYAQAAKAEEYEAKAKAFDLISIALDKNTKIQPDRMGWINTADFTSDVEDIIREYESGEYDE